MFTIMCIIACFVVSPWFILMIPFAAVLDNMEF